MKKPMSALRAVLSHATLVLALSMLVFFIIDRVNVAMVFLNNDLTKWLLAVFALFAALLSALVIIEDEKRHKDEAARRDETKGDGHDRTR